MRADALVLLAVLLLAAFGTRAAEPAPLQPLRATYAASLNGMPMGVDVVMELSGGGNDDWNLSLRAGSSMFRYLETSDFHWRGCIAEPRRYRFEFKGFGIDRKLWLDFDHARNIATGVNRKGEVSYPFAEDASDELSLTWAARCALARGETRVTFRVAAPTGMKNYTWQVDGREALKTPLGMLDTLRVSRVRKDGDKRRTTMWVAPSLDWLMVKTEHVEKFGVRGAINLKSLERNPAPGAKP